jgi:hypothetical protein
MGLCAAVSGLGLEAVPQPLPKSVQPVAKWVYRFFRKSPGATRVCAHSSLSISLNFRL